MGGSSSSQSAPRARTFALGSEQRHKATRALGFDETLNCEYHQYHHLVHETVPDREELI